MLSESKFDPNRTYTALEYLTLPDSNDKEYELVGGKLTEKAVPSVMHDAVISLLARHFESFLKANPVGKSVKQITFVLDTANVYRTDLAFLPNNHLDGLDTLDGFPGSPDLAVEVLSNGDLIFNLDQKIEQYLAWGTRLIWVINPRRQTVEIFRPGALKPQVLDVNDDLDGEVLLPGFRLRVSRLFE